MAVQGGDDRNTAGAAAGTALTARQEFQAYWPVVVASFVGLMFGAWALPIYMLGPLTKSFETTLGWDRADIVFCQTFLAIGTTIGNPLVGIAVDRMSPRVVALISQFLLALCLVGMSMVNGSVLQLQLLYLAMGLFGAGSGGVSFTRSIGAAFQKGRGLALGIALCGTGAAAFATPLLAQFFVSMIGWRTACLCIAALIVMLAMPTAAWGLRNRRPTGPAASAPRLDLLGVTRAEAMRDPRFYLLGVSIGLFGLFIGSIIVNMVPMFVDKGMTAEHAAQAASLLGIAIIVGRLVIGSLLDRFPPALIGAGIFMIGGLGAFVFVVGGTAFAVPMVLASGFLLGAEIDLLAYLTLRYFGARHYGVIFGLLFGSYTLCAILGPGLNKLLLAQGGYDMMFIGTAIGFLISGLLLLCLSLFRRESSFDSQPHTSH